VRAAIIAAFSIAALVGLSQVSGPTETALGSAQSEPYAPFEMTYVVDDGDRVQVLELSWHSVNDWTEIVAADSSNSDRVGRSVTFNGVNVIIDDPKTGVEVIDVTEGGDDLHPVVPDSWFVPRDYANDSRWQSLGVGADGRALFRNTLEVDGREFVTTYTQDPDTKLVTSVESLADGVRVKSVRVTSLEPGTPSTGTDRPASPGADSAPDPEGTAAPVE
jgi:hypothetical protein